LATLKRADGSVICERLELAESPPARMRGLLGRDELPAGQGLLLRPAGSIHTAFMRFPIDAVFLDRELTVLRVVRHLPPWHMAAERGAKAVLELPAGEADRVGLRPGDRLYAETASSASPGS
jgi:uncharacterized membrane protein (UPF0127 family)